MSKTNTKSDLSKIQASQAKKGGDVISDKRTRGNKSGGGAPAANVGKSASGGAPVSIPASGAQAGVKSGGGGGVKKSGKK